VARGDDQLAVIAAMLEGTENIPGLTMDAEMRWHLLRRLVSCGAAPDAQIDAELDRDDTAAGRRYAAGAFAARPTSRAKEEAWSSIISDDALPNAMLNAVIGGFAQVEQEHLLEPFVDRYFAALPKIWAERTNKMAQNIVIGLYPGYRIDPSTIEKTDAFLNSADHPPALRRLLLESRDGIVRSLRARECDRAAG
jgi:aminopeptidase N